MITILPADEAFLKEMTAPAGTDAMVLREGGEVTGYALFRLTDGVSAGDTVEILRVEAQEPLLVDGLIRSVLNTGDCRGAKYGLCRVAALEPVLRRLEFRPAEDEQGANFRIVIEEFFNGPCPSEKGMSL